MPPFRILHLRDTYEVGGPGKTILETYKHLDATRFEMHIGVFLTRAESGDTPFVRAAADYGLPVHFIRGHNQFDARLITRTAALARQLRVDVVHAHEVKSDVIGLLAARLAGMNSMTTLHGWIGNGRRDRFMTALDLRVLRGFDRVIAVSAAIGAKARAAGVAAERLHVLHNAIVLSRYQRTGDTGFLAGVAGRPLAPPVITSIGRLSPEKGHADLIEAFALGAARGLSFTGVLVGDGPARGDLEALVAARGLASRVHFVGYRTEAARILENTDLMVLPSHTEGLPNVVLEALAMGTPVLASAVGGTPEVIEDGCGRLVPARSPGLLAAGIEDFLTNRPAWAAMAARGRTRVETHFGFDARTRRLEAIYDGLGGVH